MSQNKEFYTLNCGDLWFNMVKICDERQKEQWQQYSDGAGYIRAGSGGVCTFRSALDAWSNFQTEVWVAYVSMEPMVDIEKINKNSIEMYISVTTSAHAPFTSHMGIQRVNPADKHQSHKHIANQLHTFCARIMHERYPEKIYMINSPQEVARDILCKGLLDKGCSDAINIYDNRHNIGDNFLQLALDNKREELNKHYTSGSTLYPHKFCADMNLLEHLIKQRKEKKPQFFDLDENGKVTIYDSKNGEKIIEFASKEGEFKWFLGLYDQLIGVYSTDTPMIGVDLSLLAKLDDNVASASLGHAICDAMGDVICQETMI